MANPAAVHVCMCSLPFNRATRAALDGSALLQSGFFLFSFPAETGKALQLHRQSGSQPVPRHRGGSKASVLLFNTGSAPCASSLLIR